jgi:putative N6-adenine-specific DNA methylase
MVLSIKKFKKSSSPAAILTFRGFEEIAALEIKEILGEKAVPETEFVTFFATDKQLAELCYKTQTTRRVLRLFGTFSFSSLETLKQSALATLEKTDLSIFSSKTFRVECERYGIHSFTSQEIAASLGGVFLQQQSNTSVALEDPDIIVYCFIRDNFCLLGVDLAGFDLSKREYKIYAQTHMLNAAFAYCAVRYAGYSGKEALVDPLSGVGLLPLEAALFAAHVSPRFHQKQQFLFHRFLKIDLAEFDIELPKKTLDAISLRGYDVQLRNIEAAKKHAKLAGVAKHLTFARADIEWIDTKVDEKSQDIVVAQMPVEGRAVSENDMLKFYKEFFYQLEFVMKDSGTMVLLCQKTGVLKQALEYFTLVKEHTAWQGEQLFILITLKKTKK